MQGGEQLKVYRLCFLLVLLASSGDSRSEARRLFELGDYPAAEEALGRILAALPESALRERALRLSERAEARVLQGIHAGAAEDIEAAISCNGGADVRRSAVSIYLRIGRHRDALPHIETGLSADPRDSFLRFSRGIVRSRLGLFEEALPDLAIGFDLPGAGRDARFESALALGHLGRDREALRLLRVILEIDPTDAEACYQASRRLLAIGGPGPSRTAAHLVKYFEALRGMEGASSRAEHLAFAGRAADAALERAEREERLGRFDRALEEVERARRTDPVLAGRWLDSFRARQGFGPDPTPEKLLAEMGAARNPGDPGRGDRAARLLLAIRPDSIPALTHLAARSADPALIVPRIHFLARLSKASGGDSRAASDLEIARKALEGAP